jgi:hypothetical protein
MSIAERPKTPRKPKSLTKETTTQFHKDKVEEAAIHEYVNM